MRRPQSFSLLAILLLGSSLFLCCTPTAPAIEEGKYVLVPPSYSGVDFVNGLEDTETFNILNYLYYYNGGGVAVADFDRDKLPDLFFTANLNDNRLYHNQGGFRFEDITQSAGVAGPKGSWSTGVSIADVNQDGWPDIYVSQLGDYLDKKGHNLLYINNGDLTFREAAAEYGLDLVGFSTQAAFFDYDRDGDLDMFQLSHSISPSSTVGDTSQRRLRDPLAGDKLLRNENGKFVDVSERSGIIGSRLGYGLSVLVGDINGDDWPDLYVCNDFHEDDYLYLNQGNGHFAESLREVIGHTSRFSMGSDLADFNHDGRLDIMSLDMKPEREDILKTAESPEPYDVYQFKRSFGYHHQFPHNALQLNMGTAHDGNPRFAEIAQFAGVDATDWSWSGLFCDIDNDGAEDLFITNGIYRRPNDMDYIKFLSDPDVSRQLKGAPSAEDLKFIEKMPSVRLPNYLYRQTSSLRFRNEAKERGLDTPAFSNGSAYADLDLDGDLDLVVNNLNQQAFIYRNDLPQGNYLRIQPKNGQGPLFGTKVEIWAGEDFWYRELYPVRGFQSCVEPILHFGLGQHEQADSMRVSFPDGSRETLREISVNQFIEVLPETQGEISSSQTKAVSIFGQENRAGELFVHRENIDLQAGGFNDFRQEVLIPHMLSTEGPALAVADINGDGQDDFFIGGGRNQAAALWQQGNLTFEPVSAATWNTDKGFEDVDALFVEVNGDSWPDLYVVSGGNEYPPGDLRNQDRLYINQAGKAFVKAPAGSLPELRHNGACISAADWDQDGDQDLFVGNRSVAGQYGVFPPAFWLQNDGSGHFEKVELMDQAFSGMISDAEFDDFDGDGDQDLWVVGEWMPITLLENQEGHFSRKKVAALDKTHGWWNRLLGADFDQDGDTDWMVGNLGLNSDIKASEEEPCTLYLKDFDQNGALDPIICAFNQGVSYPVASKDEITRQIISLRGRYERYSDYAQSTITDLFDAKALEDAVVRNVYQFASVYIENLGKGEYKLQALPAEAQFSPLYAMLATDVDNDGHQDAILSGNFFSVGPAQARYDASFGWYLKGDGKGDFELIPPSQSGLWIEGESRRMGLLQSPGQASLLLVARNNGPLGIWQLPIN